MVMEEPTVVILLRNHVVRQLPKYLCFSPFVCAVLNLAQRGSFLQEAKVNTDSSLVRVLGTSHSECSALNETSIIN